MVASQSDKQDHFLFIEVFARGKLIFMSECTNVDHVKDVYNCTVNKKRPLKQATSRKI